MSDDQLARGSAGWIARQAVLAPALMGRAARYISGGQRSSDACLKARRYLEYHWHLDPARLPGEADYRAAARWLEKAGHEQAAVVLEAVAGTDAELRAAAQAWTARYAGRPAADAEALLARHLADGTVTTGPANPVLGVDGSWYQLAALGLGAGLAAEPAVLVTTMTGRDLVTGFAAERAAISWIGDRMRSAGRKGPLADPAVEHLPRVTLEEHVLAWLLRQRRALPADGPALTALPWTADCRREFAAALHTATSRDRRAGPREAAAELARRMLRAPGWAADQVGWPAGMAAQDYLKRLAATPVPEAPARHALAVLTLDPTAADLALAELALRHAAPGAAVADVQVTPAPRSAARIAGEHEQRMAVLMDRSAPYLDQPDSVAARMRITGPRP
ncbi:MAG TPA: hypothetical protein VFB06_02770 [Streptosporangiaceae bacterium]|nr:hypothetical protein [Streptosporangiaceae bacterium]